MADTVRDFERTLAQLHEVLSTARIPYMVVGGVAVFVHGVPRLTRDVDITILLQPDEADRLLDALGPSFRSRVDDPLAFAEETRVLPVEAEDGTFIDVIFAGLPFEEEAIGRSKPAELGEATFMVCSAEDLILMKILSERPRDLEDVRGVYGSCGEALDRDRLDPLVEGLAADLDRPGIATFWKSLTNPETGS